MSICVVDHRAEWVGDFEAIAAALRATLGASALRIDHVGSTAVPALCAKDIIDIQVTMPALDISIAQCLMAAGYSTHTHWLRQDHLPPGTAEAAEDWRKFFFMQPPGQRRCNIHLRPVGKPNQRYALLFRDFLRTDRHMTEAYGLLKRRLAASLADAKSYPDVKDPAADLIYLAAQRWALQTRWQPTAAE